MTASQLRTAVRSAAFQPVIRNIQLMHTVRMHRLIVLELGPQSASNWFAASVAWHPVWSAWRCAGSKPTAPELERPNQLDVAKGQVPSVQRYNFKLGPQIGRVKEWQFCNKFMTSLGVYLMIISEYIRYIKIPFKMSQTLQVYKCALRCPHFWKLDPPFFNHRIHLTCSRSDHTLLAPRALQQMVASLKPREAKGLIQKWVSFARRNSNLCHFSSKKMILQKALLLPSVHSENMCFYCTHLGWILC